MWTLPSDPSAVLEMDVAIADFILSRNYDFTMVDAEKFKHMLRLARRVPPDYKPPTVARVGGELLNKLFDVNWNTETDRLLKDARTFGISMFGDGATIKTFTTLLQCWMYLTARNTWLMVALRMLLTLLGYLSH
jgi:hypothetical protein